jgi:hypothetical protein
MRFLPKVEMTRLTKVLAVDWVGGGFAAYPIYKQLTVCNSERSEESRTHNSTFSKICRSVVKMIINQLPLRKAYSILQLV